MHLERGRIVKGVGGLYTVAVGGARYTCVARGLFRKQKATPLIGDIVDIQILDEAKLEGCLHTLITRRNELIRPKSANIDLALVVFAASNPVIQPDLLDSFLLSCERQNVDAAICINKTDLQLAETADDFDAFVAEYRMAGYPILCVSAEEHKGIDELQALVQGKTVIFAGPSGVGKSSLINALLPEAQMETGELSKKLARGKHTTRHTELLQVNDDTFIVDSPGFSSLGVTDIKAEDLPSLYPEIRQYIGQCFYNDCMHVSEPDCAIRAHLGDTIGTARYNRYISFLEKIKDAR